jgi:hypothetical protein
MADHTGPEIPQVSADSLTQAIRSDAGAGSSPEISPVVLEVHAPHETIHGWKSFLTHIAAIVVGLLIAVSLEQTVEFFHHGHQREQLEATLRTDGEANRRYIKDDIAIAQGVLDWALEQTVALERAAPTDPLTLRHMPHGSLGLPNAGVWPSAKASGVTNLLPASAQNWFEYLADEYNKTFVSSASANGQLSLAYAALDQAMIGHAVATPSGDIDVSTLTVAQRAAVDECLRAIAEQARTVMRQLVIFDSGNEYLLTVPLDQLAEPQAENRYSQILREKMEAHAAAKFVFAGN